MQYEFKVRRLIAAAVAVSLSMIECGCGNRGLPVFPVQGELRYNKEPAAKALVIFTPQENTDAKNWPNGYPRGVVKEDGSYKLSTYGETDGAPAGEYAVTVLWLENVEGSHEEKVDKLQGRYADAVTSKYRFQVKADRKGTTIEPIELR
jgi:hypothetical protein